MRASRSVRQQVIATAHRLHERGWVANHDGNITVRIGKGRYLATPTATSKADVGESNLIEVDDTGKRISGTARPFSELVLHTAVYAARDDVNAVVHAHPPHATAIACSNGNPIERPFIAEAIVSIGDSIPKVPFAAPGADSAKSLAPYLGVVDAVLLAGHGALAWGADLEQAYLRLELVEHLARIALLAQPTGGVQALPDDLVATLLAKRAKSGLGAAADRAGSGAAPKAVVACAPAPHANVAVIPPGGSDGKGQLASVIREEIVRALKEHK
jgi:L-fuculose-phosphate aldolase